MSNSLKLNRALDEQADIIYYELEEIVKGIDELALKNSQLNSLVSVANATTEVTGVAKFVEYQASREARNFDGWRALVTTRDQRLCDVIAQFSKKVATERAIQLIASLNETANDADEKKKRERMVAIEILRRYVLAFTVLYRYRLKREGRLR